MIALLFSSQENFYDSREHIYGDDCRRHALGSLIVRPRLMHCLPSKASLALSPSRLVMVLSASFCALSAGVLGCKAGKPRDDAYSEALAKSKVAWDRMDLERWLTSAERVIFGQRMGYRLWQAAEPTYVMAYVVAYVVACLATLAPFAFSS